MCVCVNQLLSVRISASDNNRKLSVDQICDVNTPDSHSHAQLPPPPMQLLHPQFLKTHTSKQAVLVDADMKAETD